MNIGEYSVKTPVISWLLVIIMVGGGIWGFERMGKGIDACGRSQGRRQTERQMRVTKRY